MGDYCSAVLNGLVKTRRSGQAIYYSLAGAEASAVMETLHDLYCGRTQEVEARRRAGLPE